MSETIARNVGPAGIDVAYERIGDPAMAPVLLIQGISAQLVAWPDGFCTFLADYGFDVIRYDNRDVGRSTHFHDAPEPDLPAALAGDLSSASYTLSDMAADAAASSTRSGSKRPTSSGRRWAATSPKPWRSSIPRGSGRSRRSCRRPAPSQ